MRIFILSKHRPARRVFALLAVFTLLSNSLFVGAAGAQTAAGRQAAARSLSEEQRVVHVLNRLAFGPRPGDIERVRRVGIERYIEQQLNPSNIDDSVVEAKLKSLPTLRMSNGELLANYPNPGQLIRRMRRRGELPPELAALVGQRNQGQTGGASDAGKMDDKGARPGAVPKAEDGEPAMREEDASERRAYRRALQQYMRENGLEPPQRVMQELQASRILRAVYSERQLQEVMVDFWTNHFNVFAGKGADRWLLTSYDRDVIRPNALGNFRDLLEATAKSPAMLFYLDNFQSVSPNAGAGRGGLLRRMRMRELMPGGQGRRGGLSGGGRRLPDEGLMRQRRGAEIMGGQQGGLQPSQPRPQQRMRRGINENYARELMELHTLGVGGGYTQRDVQEVARAFTGWTIIAPRGGPGNEALEGRAGTFVFNPRAHDDGEKTVLGRKIPGGGGMRDGQLVLDLLARHPSTAKFIATKLCRRFVSDDPAPALVVRVAEAFRQSDGDIRATLRAVFSSPEFNSVEARRAKIKTPFELAVSAVRALGAETDARPALHQWVARMGEPLYMYQAPTGYPDTAGHWVNTGALLERLNFALALVSNRIPGTRVDLARFVGDAATSGRAVDQARVVDQFLALILQGDISPKSREVLMKQLSGQATAPITAATPGETATNRNPRAARREQGVTVGDPEVARIAALIVGSPEFQRQ